MGFLCVIFTLISCELLIISAVGMNNIIPAGWERMCSTEIDNGILGTYLENAPRYNQMISLQCHVNENDGDLWRFQVLWDHLWKFSDVFVFLQVKCTIGGKISLPWPMKAKGLVGIVVSKCILTEKYADLGNPNITLIPDQLKVLVIRDSVWLSDGSGFDKLTHQQLSSLTADYDCGQDSTIEILITSNVSDRIDIPAESSTPVPSEINLDKDQRLDFKTLPSSDGETRENVLNLVTGSLYNHLGSHDQNNPLNDVSTPPGLTSSGLLHTNISLESNGLISAETEFLELVKNLESLDIKCNFEKLKLIDESLPQFFPVMHFRLMVKGSSYPELRVMNYSMSGIRELPQELKDFKIYFPKLKYLDLSWNYLTEITLPAGPKLEDSEILTINVRNNLIANISMDDIEAWSNAHEVFVDIRDNPIHCGCHMHQLLEEIQTNAFDFGKRHRYAYVKDLVCNGPVWLKGQKLSQLDLKCQTEKRPSFNHLAMSNETVVIVVVCLLVAVLVVCLPFLFVLIINRRSSRRNLNDHTVEDATSVATQKEIEAGLSNQKPEN